jgi:hypothetical protein
LVCQFFGKEKEMKTTKSKIRCGGMLAILVLTLGLIAEVSNADFTFGTPNNLGSIVNSPQSDVPCFVSVDGLELYFFSERSGGFGNSDIWVTTRETVDDDWGTPLNLGPPVNSSYLDTYANVSADGLELYFTSTRPGGLGLEDIWVTRRESKDDTWDPPVNLGPAVNSSARDYGAFISADGLEFYFNSMRSGGFGSYHDLYVMRRTSVSDDWGAPVNLGPVVNGPSHDIAPNLSADGRYLFFSDHPWQGFRYGGFGNSDIWVTSRPTTSDEWGVPVNLGPTINTKADDCVPNLSADGSTLYFMSNRSGGVGRQDMWQAPILPIVDFNGDRIVDSADMCIMVDHWGTDEPLCDIGPMPWGDGIVDVQDLIVLAEHLFEEVFPVELVAYWKLDEVEGDIAYNSTSDNHGILSGNPTWKPDSGQVAGALEFDGIDDYITTDFVLNPILGPFSAFAWIKGGSSGQVVISQIGGEDWLLADAEGKLMTKLRRGSYTPILASGSGIIDGDWHHIGVVWDGSHRHLYVDGTDVAEDATDILYLWASNGGLYVGADKNLEVDSFWSGLIDDVRIYNRAVTP